MSTRAQLPRGSDFGNAKWLVFALRLGLSLQAMGSGGSFGFEFHSGLVHVYGLGFRVQGLGLRVEGVGPRSLFLGFRFRPP